MGLDGVGWVPGEPSVVGVFGGVDLEFGVGPGKIVANLFLHRSGAKAFLLDGVVQVESEAGVDSVLGRVDAGFLGHFAGGGLEESFVAVAVAFGEVPSFGVPHQ